MPARCFPRCTSDGDRFSGPTARTVPVLSAATAARPETGLGGNLHESADIAISADVRDADAQPPSRGPIWR